MELQENLVEIVEDLGDLVRASLQRRLPPLLRHWAAPRGAGSPAQAPLSRATLGSEPSNQTRESG